MPESLDHEQLVQLRDLIHQSFDLNEFRTLCFDLGVRYDDLPGEGLRTRVTELVSLCDRTGRIEHLLARCVKLRPHSNWLDLNKTIFEEIKPAVSTRPVRNPRQIFISHAHQDTEFAHRLANDLRQQNWDIWIAPESIPIGGNWMTAIRRGLDECGIFILVLTPDAVHSTFVTDETDTALMLKSRGSIRFIILDVKPVATPPSMWQANQWIPFQGSYKVGFERFMQELQPEKMGQLAKLYGQLQQAMTRNDWALAQSLGAQITANYPDYRETEERIALARREAEREQANWDEATRLYPRLKIAVVRADWANALALTDQIDQLAPNYQDVAQLKDRARRGLRQQQSQHRQKQWQNLHGQLPRFTRWVVSGGAVIILLMIACVGSVVLLSQFINNDENSTKPPTQTRPIVANTTPEPPQPTIPTPTFTHTATSRAILTATQAPSATISPEPIPITTPTSSKTPTPTLTRTATPTLNPNIPPPNPQLGDRWTRPTDGMVMVYVPAGTFLMGSNPDVDQNAEGDEQPQHQVTLMGFWLDRTEVTNSMYRNCVADGNCSVSGYANNNVTYNGDDFPIVGASWNHANTYCIWAGGQLPTEAQWEYAARGDNGRLYPWGNETPTCNRAQFGNCDGDTVRVGSFSPEGDSWVGATDMAGNMWEWVADWYSGNYYEISPMDNPTGPLSTMPGNFKVMRGGVGVTAHSLYVVPTVTTSFPVTLAPKSVFVVLSPKLTF